MSQTPSREQEPEAPISVPAPPAAMQAPDAQGLAGYAQSLQRTIGNRATGQVLGRKVKLDKPEAGSPSAYDRKGELVARINAQSLGVLYALGPDDRLTYRIVGECTPFDKQMIDFIDATPVVPLKLVTNAATITQTYNGDTAAKGATITSRLLVDSFDMGWFDLDDLLASTDESFQLNLIHVLTERLAVTDYEHKVGRGLGGTFQGAHEAGLQAEAKYLRALFGDDSIEYVGNYEDATHFSDYGAVIKGTNRAAFNYESKSEGYRIQHDLQLVTGGKQFGQVVVFKKGSNTPIPVQDFLAERRKD